MTVSAVPTGDGCYHEVWLGVAQVDGAEIQLSQLPVAANKGWIYHAEYDDYVFYPKGSTDEENFITFSVTFQKLSLTFGKNAWSGAAEISINEQNTSNILLTSEESDSLSISFTMDPVDPLKEYSLKKLGVLGFGAWLVAYYCLNILWDMVALWCKKSTGKESIRWTAISFLIFLNAGVLFFSNDKIHPSAFTVVLLLLLTIASLWCVQKINWDTRMQKYRTRGCAVWIFLLSAYASFASFGQRFFLNGNTRMHWSTPGLFYGICGMIWFLPIIWMLLWGLEYLSSLVHQREEKTISRRKAWWTVFISLVICQIIVLGIMWPGGFPADAMEQILQASGLKPLSDWHPVLHTLIIRAILMVFPQAGAIIAVQSILFVWLLTAYLMLGYDRGLSVVGLCVMGGLFIFLPNQAFSWTSPLKDSLFTIALLWGIYLLLQIVMDSAWSKKVTFMLCLALDIFLIVGLRHNGIIPAVAVGLALMILTVKYFRRYHLRFLVSIGLSVIMIAGFKGPVFDYLNVSPNPVSPYTTMLCAVGSCINKNLPLSEETMKTMEKILPLEDWKTYYNRFQGHDPYYFGRKDNTIPYDTSKLTAQEAFRAYFDALIHYPDVVIKDRIDGMDIMWDVVQPSDSFNARAFHFITRFDGYDYDRYFDLTDWSSTNENSDYYKQTFFAKLYHRTLSTSINSAADILLWRTGAYLIAFLVLLLFWWKNRMGILCIASVPMLGNIACYLLVLYHQSFRYVYFIQVGVLAMLFVSIALKNDWDRVHGSEQSEKLNASEQ